MSTHPSQIDIRFEIRLHKQEQGWTREAYDHIYMGEGIRQLDSFYRWLLQLLRPIPGRNLLDIACGEGVLPHFAQTEFGLHAVGSDLSFAAAKIGAKDGSAHFCVNNGESLPFTNASFDYVTCIGSLEHFLNMETGIREMVRVLRPDGLACILLPNTYGLLNNVYKAFKTGWSTIDEQPLQRYLARAEWAALLEAGGFQVLDTIKYERETPTNMHDRLWYASHPRALVKLALAPFIPLNLATCFVYICRPHRRPQGEAA